MQKEPVGTSLVNLTGHEIVVHTANGELCVPPRAPFLKGDT